MRTYSVASCIVIVLCILETGVSGADCDDYEDETMFLHVKTGVKLDLEQHASVKPSKAAAAKASGFLSRAYKEQRIAEAARQAKDETMVEEEKLSKDIETLEKVVAESQAARTAALDRAQQLDKRANETKTLARTAMLGAFANLDSEKKNQKKMTRAERNRKREEAQRFALDARLLFKEEHDLENLRNQMVETATVKGMEEDEKKKKIEAATPQLRSLRMRRDKASEEAEEAEVVAAKLHGMAAGVLSMAARREQLLAEVDAKEQRLQERAHGHHSLGSA